MSLFPERVSASSPAAASSSDAAPETASVAPAASAASSPDVFASSAEPAPRARRFRGVWAVLGFIAFGFGMVGVAVPVLPTTPFILLAAFCFARSSERLNAWFKGTAVYRKVFDGLVSKRSMTLKSKLLILASVTALLAVGFILMANVPVGRVAVVLVWLGHIIYFGFVVKTERAGAESAESCEGAGEAGGAGDATLVEGVS